MGGAIGRLSVPRVCTEGAERIMSSLGGENEEMVKEEEETWRIRQKEVCCL